MPRLTYYFDVPGLASGKGAWVADSQERTQRDRTKASPNGTTYYYKVTAVNSAGASAQSAEVSAAPMLTVPPAPTGLTATAGNAQVALTWNASVGAASYNIYRSTTSGGEGSTPFQTGMTSTSFTDTSVTNGTTYYYEVTAVNAAGESTKSSEVSATPGVALNAPAFVQANATSASTTVALSATTAGDTLIVEADFTGSFTSIKDNQGNTYVEIGGQETNFGVNSRLFYATGIKGGPLTVTATLGGPDELYVSEYSGVAANPLDGFCVNVGTGTAFSSNSLTTTAANDLLYGAEIDSGAGGPPAAGWNVRNATDENVVADETASTPGAYAFTGASSGGSIAWIAAFKPAGATTNTPPSITAGPSATPATVTGKTTNLSVTATDSDGDALTYTWAVTSGPTGVTFSANGTGTANNTTATFTQAGSYIFKVTVTDTAGLTATSSVSVTVNQTFSSIGLFPGNASVPDAGTVAFNAKAFDQFGNVLATQPTFTWSIVSGIGTVSSSGLYTAPATGTGSAVVQARIGCTC